MRESGEAAGKGDRIEKRGAERKRVHWRMLILFTTGEKKPGYVIDVSEGGMQIQSMYSFPTGSIVNIAVFVPDAQKPGSYLGTPFVCKVVYQVLKGADVQLGLVFVNLAESARQRIRAAMNMG